MLVRKLTGWDVINEGDECSTCRVEVIGLMTLALASHSLQ